MEEFDKTGQDITKHETIQGDFDFFDFLRILYQRRYIIFLGTAVIVVIIAFISFSTPSVYRSQTVVKPGLSNFDEESRKWVHLATPVEMKLLIETEMQFKVAEQKSQSKDTQESFPLVFKVIANNSNNTVTVFYDSPTQDDGITSMQFLLDALKETYHQKLQPFFFQLESGIALAQKELMLISKDQGFINENFNAILTHFEKFKHEYNSALENPVSLQKTGRYLAEYTAIIDRIARLKQNRSALFLKSALLNDEIEKRKIEKNSLYAIKVIQPPTTISVPNRKNLILNLIAAPVVGLCLMVFLVFFFEYLRNLIPKIKQKKIFE
ncbi:hypothetical protein ACFL36_04075 [Thermodesulfobacteriota bacterium]